MLEDQEGGPVGLRAVPTELRWKAPLNSPPNAAMVLGTTSDASAAPDQASGGFSGGNPNVVSTGDARDRTPGKEGCEERRREPGSSAFAVSWSRRSKDCTEATLAAACSAGREGRATGAIARRAANQTASQLRNCLSRCAGIAADTSPLSGSWPATLSKDGLQQRRRQGAPCTTEVPDGRPPRALGVTRAFGQHCRAINRRTARPGSWGSPGHRLPAPEPRAAPR